MKAEEAGAGDLERLRTLFAAEREANFPEFTDVYCVDAADDVLARFARARRGDPDAALAFLREDYEWRKAEDAASLRSTPPAAVLGQDPAVLAEYYRHRCVGLDSAGRLTFYQAYACCVVKKLKTVVPLERVRRRADAERPVVVTILVRVERVVHERPQHRRAVQHVCSGGRVPRQGPPALPDLAGPGPFRGC